LQLNARRRSWIRHPRRWLDRLDEAADRINRVEVDGATIAVNAEGVNLHHGHAAGVAHLGHDRSIDSTMVETLSVLLEPFRMDARPGDWLDQFVRGLVLLSDKRADQSAGRPWQSRPADGRFVEEISTPRSDSEHRLEPLGRDLEIV